MAVLRGCATTVLAALVADFLAADFLVGAVERTTAEDARYYQPGDRHRVMRGNAPGQVTVCVAQAEPSSPAICQRIEIPRTTPVVRDGHRGGPGGGHGIYPAIPMIFQR